MPNRIQMDETLKAVLLDPSNLPRELQLNGKQYVPEATAKAGHKGAVWRVKDEYGRLRAAKLAIVADYNERSYLKEVALGARLDQYDEFAR
jgi:hypothetical protein